MSQMKIPYLPNTEVIRQEMLEEIDVECIDDLFTDIPKQFLNVPFNLPEGMSELDLKREITQLSKRNCNMEDYACFLGGGYYHHFIPSVIGHLTGRSEFYTAYTPYQAEVSQGTLQSIYEYQSLMCQLTGMEVSNASMYDGSTAASEAVLMACRITKRNRVAIRATVNPRYVSVMNTYLGSNDYLIETIDSDKDRISSEHACIVIQHPNYYGYFEDVESFAREAHENGAMLIVIFDPISLGLLRPPGDYGADIAVAEGQSLGSPVNFGGPGVGIFTCRKDYMRQIPGRLVSRTTDVDGNTGYVLTLATREQHIRRERATSNICTNEALVALAATIYLASMGKSGLRHVAELCYHKAHYAAQGITELDGYSLVFPQLFFNEFVLRCPAPPGKINRALLEKGIIGGLDISHYVENGMLLCVTEMNTVEEIGKLVDVLKRMGK